MITQHDAEHAARIVNDWRKSWRKISPTPLLTPCIEWQKCRYRAGYGMVRKNKRAWRVHRLEWEKHHGPIPPGLCVLHKCDNPPCYNIEHLYLGTHADNTKEKFAKGRGGPRLKTFTLEQLAEIRRRLINGDGIYRIGRSFNVGHGVIWAIKIGRTYRNEMAILERQAT